MRTVVVESQVRSRIVEEYEERLREVERHYQKRLRDEVRSFQLIS